MAIVPPHCWACGKDGPNQKALKGRGWKVRPAPIPGTNQTEVYCPSCWSLWGWPDWSKWPLPDGVGRDLERRNAVKL